MAYCGNCSLPTFGASALLAVVGWSFVVCPPIQALAHEQKACECKFSRPPWEAFGAKAACSAFTRPGKTSCNIEFGGIGTDTKIAAEILGLDPTTYKRDTYDQLTTYLQLLRDDKKAQLIEPKFLSRALITFMRGAYLRGPL